MTTGREREGKIVTGSQNPIFLNIRNLVFISNSNIKKKTIKYFFYI